jgi:hypothetical protein
MRDENEVASKHLASLSRFVEALNRYIGGGRKRDQTTICVVSRIRDAEYDLVAHGSLAAAAATAITASKLT